MRRSVLLATTAGTALTGGLAIPLLVAVAEAATTHVVVVKHLKFSPAKLTVKAGDTVKWEFEDGGVPHNVTSTKFHSPLLKSGSWSYRFTRKGAYSYSCTIHPFMKAEIVVR
jgi:plastocyanin